VTIHSQPDPEDEIKLLHEGSGLELPLPLTQGSISAAELQKIPLGKDLPGVLSFDPALLNTATCRSAITWIDGDEGVLNHRGYPIEQLADRSSFPEVCWLLLEGELPTSPQKIQFENDLAEESVLPADIVELFQAFPAGLHPMSMLTAALAALGAKYPEAEDVLDPKNRRRQIHRLLAKTPALGALCYRTFTGQAPVGPRPELGYAGSFLRMLLGEPGEEYEPSPSATRAMDALLILHADHEQNCSTNAVRAVASSLVNPYSAVSSGCAALQGPLHGGANQAVLEMLDAIATVENIPTFLEACKKGETRLMGFGHRVYKSYDPRAKVIRRLALDVLADAGPSPRLDVARQLEIAAREDDYFVSRKLFPNVDFYSGLIYSALGFPPEVFTMFFAVGRMTGWLAHWDEMLQDPKHRIVRPRQIYVGPEQRDFPA